MQGTVIGAAQMLTQGSHNCSNLHSKDIITIMRRGLPNGLQASSCRARKDFGTTSNTKSTIKIVKQEVWKTDPTGLASIFFQNLRVRRHSKNLQKCQPQFFQQHSIRHSVFYPTDVPQVLIEDLFEPEHGYLVHWRFHMWLSSSPVSVQENYS